VSRPVGRVLISQIRDLGAHSPARVLTCGWDLAGSRRYGAFLALMCSGCAKTPQEFSCQAARSDRGVFPGGTRRFARCRVRVSR
jgi:hypothetical protein